MDGRTGLLLVCATLAGVWLLLAGSLVAGRLRGGGVGAQPVVRQEGDWPALSGSLARVGLDDAEAGEARSVLFRALRTSEPEVRTAGITALGGLGDRYEWAIDGLVEALVHDADDAVNVASHLDRLAPRPGPRLPPLLGHPSASVRFYAVRLLARYEALAARHVPEMTMDRSPNVRAAALETLRAVASAEALRCALRLVDDPSPLVRAHASRTASAIAPLVAAPFLVQHLSDRSWWVREAAREGLVAAGRDVTGAVAPALESDDEALRAGAALVMQDVGFVDELAGGDDVGQLERILEAGGRRLRSAAADRARHGLRLGTPEPLVESA